MNDDDPTGYYARKNRRNAEDVEKAIKAAAKLRSFIAEHYDCLPAVVALAGVVWVLLTSN